MTLVVSYVYFPLSLFVCVCVLCMLALVQEWKVLGAVKLNSQSRSTAALISLHGIRSYVQYIWVNKYNVKIWASSLQEKHSVVSVSFYSGVTYIFLIRSCTLLHLSKVIFAAENRRLLGSGNTHVNSSFNLPIVLQDLVISTKRKYIKNQCVRKGMTVDTQPFILQFTCNNLLFLLHSTHLNHYLCNKTVYRLH